MSKRTLFLIFALFIIALTLLITALYQPQAPKATPVKKVAKESSAFTILSFGIPVVATSSSALPQPGVTNYSLPVNISTGKNKVTAVQLELQYDPQILTNVAIATGPFFTKPDVLLNQIDVKTGRISYAFGAGLTNAAVSGNGIVANIIFSAKTNSMEKTAVIFLPKTLVTAEGISQSVLKEADAGLFTIGEKPSASDAQ